MCDVCLVCRGMSGFPGSDAAQVLDSLLTAYREGETEDLYKACDSVLFRTMDNEVRCNNLLGFCV